MPNKFNDCPQYLESSGNKYAEITYKYLHNTICIWGTIL